MLQFHLLQDFLPIFLNFIPAVAYKIFITMPQKMDITRKLCYPILRNFLPLVPKFDFWKGDWELAPVS